MTDQKHYTYTKHRIHQPRTSKQHPFGHRIPSSQHHKQRQYQEIKQYIEKQCCSRHKIRRSKPNILNYKSATYNHKRTQKYRYECIGIRISARYPVITSHHQSPKKTDYRHDSNTHRKRDGSNTHTHHDPFPHSSITLIQILPYKRTIRIHKNRRRSTKTQIISSLHCINSCHIYPTQYEYRNHSHTYPYKY